MDDTYLCVDTRKVSTTKNKVAIEGEDQGIESFEGSVTSLVAKKHSFSETKL
jgi:hypothetical protein